MKKFFMPFVGVLIALFSLLSIETLSAQELKLKSFEHLQFDAAAKTHQKKDLNGDPCALLRLYVSLEDVIFKASLGVMGEPLSERHSEYNLYLPNGTTWIKIYGKGYLPFTYTFDEALKGNNTYELILEVPIIADFAQIIEQQNKLLQATNQQAPTTQPSPQPVATQPVATTPARRPGTWQVGDYYNVNGKEGVVFWVDETGKHGKIVSMTESSSELVWSSDKIEKKRLIGATDEYDGAKNMEVVKLIPDWRTKYPAFKWCADLGKGWYLPAIEELKIFTLNDGVYDAVNRTLAQHGGKQLAKKGDFHWYWSSTESDKKYKKWFCAWLVYMGNGNTDGVDKGNSSYVRAVSAF